MSYDSDDFDSIPIPDISEIDLSKYDRPTQNTQQQPQRRLPPSVPPVRSEAHQLQTDDDDDEYWSDLPIRVDDGGNYNITTAQEEEKAAWVEEVKGRGSVDVDQRGGRPESSKMAAQRGIAASQLHKRSNFNQVEQEDVMDAKETALQEALSIKQDLERQVNELREQALIAKGETANLRRAATDRQAVHEKRVEELTAEKEAALASVKRKERELQESESAKAVQKALEDHQKQSHGVPGSARRPTFGPTQSVNKSHSRNPQQSQSQQTPAPLRSKGVPFGLTGMGGGFSQKFGAAFGARDDAESSRVSGSVKGKGKAKAKSKEERAPLPPVPKFPQLHNSFAIPSKRDKNPAPQRTRSPSSRSPSKDLSIINAAAGPSTPSRRSNSISESRSSHSPSKPGVASPLSKHVIESSPSYSERQAPLQSRSPFGRKKGESVEGRDASDGSPSPSKRMRTGKSLEGHGEVDVYPDDDGLGMEVQYEEDGDRTINAGEVKGTMDGKEMDQNHEHEHDEDDDEDHEDEEDEEEFWRADEKDLLLSTIFSHFSTPLSTTASRSSPSQSIQIVLAPLPSTSTPPPTAKDMEDHARCCGRIMIGVAGAGAAEIDPVYEIMRGLNGAARLFERLSMLPSLAITLKLLLSLVVRIPRAARLLLHLQTFPLLLASIKDRLFPDPLPPNARKALGGGSNSRTAKVVIDVTEAGELKQEKEKAVKAMVDLLEVLVWEAGEGEKDVLITIVEQPKFVSGLLLASQPTTVVMQTVRIIVYLSLHDALFRPLFSFPDHVVDSRSQDPPSARDPMRIPLVETLCRYLRDSHPLATPDETVVLSLDILSFFRTLIDQHQDEVTLLLAQSRSVVPTLIVSLEYQSSLIWGVSISPDVVRLSIPPLLSSLHLLSLLTSRPNLLPNLADKLRQAPRIEFNAAWERFMVGFGRICYAEVPDLKEVFWEIEEQAWRWAGEDSVVKGLGADEGAVWEGELERAGEIARDIFDLVIEGPEGDLVYAIFDTDADDVDDDEEQHLDRQQQPTETVVIDDSETEDEEMRDVAEQQEEEEVVEPVAKRVALGRKGGAKKKQQEVIVLSDDDD